MFAEGYRASHILTVFISMVSVLALTLDAAPKRKAAGRGGAKAKSSTASHSGALVFPAAGLFDPSKGSVEMIFSPSYSAEDNLATGSGISTFSILSIYGPKASGRGLDGLSWRVGIGQWQNGNHISISSSLFERPRAYKPSINYFTSGLKTAEDKTFKAGQWYSCAATWERKETNYTLRLYFDGKLRGSTRMPVSTLFGDAKPNPKDLLVIGNPRMMRGTLEALRISNRVRTKEEIAALSKNPLVKDADTLLFVDAEMALKMKTRAADILINRDKKNITIPAEGLLFGSVKEAPGRSGGTAIEFPR